MTNLNEIKKLILPVLEAAQIEFIDMELKGRTGSQLLRVFVDTETGITLDQCVALSREISDILDTHDLIAGRYRLEVSSPGLDRPLKTIRDFKKNLGRQVKIFYRDVQAEERSLNGTLAAIDDNCVVVRQDDQPVKIDISQILNAKIVPRW